MKKIFIIATLFALVTTPLSTYAFSWHSLSFWQKNTTPVVNEGTQLLDSAGEKAVQEKMNRWAQAFNKKSWVALEKDPKNFQISETEINFLIQTNLAKKTDFPVKDLSVKLADQKITLTGQLIKPISGKFETILHFDSTGKEINPVIEKMRFKRFPVPKSIINKFISQYFPKSSEFLYTYPDYQTLSVDINSGLLKLNYSK